MQCNTYLRRTKMTFQTLEYILNGIVHANITAVHCYETATALIHKLRKIMTANDAKWQSTQCKSRFSLANYYHSAFHTLIFWNRVGKQAKNMHNAKLNSSPRCTLCIRIKTGNQTNTKRARVFDVWNWVRIFFLFLKFAHKRTIGCAQSIPSWCCRRLSFAYSYVITS